MIAIDSVTDDGRLWIHTLAPGTTTIHATATDNHGKQHTTRRIFDVSHGDEAQVTGCAVPQVNAEVGYEVTVFQHESRGRLGVLGSDGELAQPFEFVRAESVRDTTVRLVFKTPPAPTQFTLTSAIDPTVNIPVTVIDLASITGIGFGRQIGFSNGLTAQDKITARVSAGSREPCDDTFPRTLVIQTPSACTFDTTDPMTAHIDGKSEIYVQGQQGASCIIHASLDSTAISADLSFKLGMP